MCIFTITCAYVHDRFLHITYHITHYILYYIYYILNITYYIMHTPVSYFAVLLTYLACFLLASLAPGIRGGIAALACCLALSSSAV